MTKPEPRIYDVSVIQQLGGDHECNANVDLNGSGPYKFSLTIPVSCYESIISGFREVGLINKPGVDKSDILEPIELQPVFCKIFGAAIGEYIDGHGSEMKQPTEIPLNTLDERDVRFLITRCYRAHLAQQQTARQKVAGK